MRLIRARQAVAGVYLPLAGGTMTGAITMQANIDLILNSILSTNLMFREDDAGHFIVRNRINTLTLGLAIRELSLNDAIAYINAQNADASAALMQARDSGVGFVEIARLQGAADPYFQATLPLRLLPIATVALPATPVEGMVTYDDTRKRVVLRNNTAWVSTMDQHTAGAVLLASANTVGAAPVAWYVLHKEIVLPGNGVFRIAFDLLGVAAGDGVSGRIYRNGVAVGTERTNFTAGWINYSEDIGGWFAGDLCQLWIMGQGVCGAGNSWRNFRLYAAVDLTTYTTNLDT